MIHHARTLLTLSILVAASSPLCAATYQWTGTSGDVSNPLNWLSNTAPAGLNTDQLLFPASSTTTANFDTAQNPWTINSLTFSGTAPITITNSNTSGISLDGAAPSIVQNSAASVTINAPVTLAANTVFSGATPVSSANALTITAPLVGPGSLTKTLNSPSLVYQSTLSPTFSGGTTIADIDPTRTLYNQPSLIPLTWNYSPAAFSSNVTLSFGAGPITLNRGAFSLANIPVASAANLALSFTNNIIVSPNGGSLTASFYSNATFYDPPLPTVLMTGNIALSGLLAAGGYTNLFASFPNITYSGTIILDQSRPYSPGTSTPEGLAMAPSDNVGAVITGNIVDDPAHPGQNPLTLLPAFGEIRISGTNNTYSHGTIIGSSNLSAALDSITQYPYSSGTVDVDASSRLGTGNVTLDGAALTLNAPSNLAPGATISGSGIVSISFDADPSSLLAPTFSGTLNLARTTFNTPLNLAAIAPDAATALRLGGTSTYTAATLAPTADHIYHLGSGGNLTLVNGVLTDSGSIPNSADLNGVTLLAANSYSGGTTVSGHVTAAAPGSLGTGNVSVNASGSLILTSVQTYSSSATLSVAGNLTLIAQKALSPLAPAPIFSPGANLTFGTFFPSANGTTDFYPDSLPLNLNSTTLNIINVGPEKIGDLSITGNSVINFQNSGPSTLNANSLLRAPGSLLTINYNYFSTPSTGLQLTTLPPLTNNMFPPYLLLGTGDFATLSANHTLVRTSYVPMPTDGGHGTEIVSDANSTLSSNTTIYALNSNANMAVASPNLTLTVLSGGIIFTNAGYYASGPHFSPNLDFGNAEAIFYGGATIDGSITCTNGLTTFGSSTLTNPNNHIAGPIHAYGSLTVTSLGDPSDTSPLQFGGPGVAILTVNAPLTTSRPILFQSDGYLDASNAPLTSTASITCTGQLQTYGNITVANTITVLPDDTHPSTLYVPDSLTANTIQCDELFLAATRVGGAPIVTLTGPVASRFLAVPTFKYTTNSYLDITHSAFIVELPNTPSKSAAAVSLNALIQAGTTDGILSSALAPLEGIAVFDNAVTRFSTFEGQPVDQNSLIVSPELLGDSNADGKVDLADLSTILQNFGQPTPLWTSGNFDNASTIDLTDLSDTLNNFGLSLSASPNIPATPEPPTLALLPAAFFLFKRRKP